MRIMSSISRMSRRLHDLDSYLEHQFMVIASVLLKLAIVTPRPSPTHPSVCKELFIPCLLLSRSLFWLLETVKYQRLNARRLLLELLNASVGA
jgi:hypothetical protein